MILQILVFAQLHESQLLIRIGPKRAMTNQWLRIDTTYPFIGTVFSTFNRRVNRSGESQNNN